MSQASWAAHLTPSIFILGDGAQYLPPVASLLGPKDPVFTLPC